MALTTLEEIEKYLQTGNIDLDDKIESLKNKAEQRVKSYLGRELEKGTYTEQVSFVKGHGFVREVPLDSVTSVTVDKYPSYTSTFTVDYSNSDGHIKLSYQYTGWATVEYEGGYENIPEDIQLAVFRLIEYYINRSAGISSMSFEDTKVGYTDIDLAPLLGSYVSRRL